MSALVLNFVPDRARALSEMKRVSRRGGRVCFYVWDYQAGHPEFIRVFWEAAESLDPGAAELAERRRFSFRQPTNFAELVEASGLQSVSCAAMETETVFRDFDDFWRPFTLGAGPAPGYCASLSEAKR